jgi:hypothetical protein
MTPEEAETARRNYRATLEAQKTDPDVLHVYTVDPSRVYYPTPEELEQLRQEAEEEIAELERIIAERDRAKERPRM